MGLIGPLPARVPADVKEGRVPLVVIQNGVPSNAAMLPVIK